MANELDNLVANLNPNDWNYDQTNLRARLNNRWTRNAARNTTLPIGTSMPDRIWVLEKSIKLLKEEIDDLKEVIIDLLSIIDTKIDKPNLPKPKKPKKSKPQIPLW